MTHADNMMPEGEGAPITKLRGPDWLRAGAWTRYGLGPGSCRGFTLVELMVALAIAGILIMALGFEFTKWRSRYYTEAQLKELYASLSSARIKAMQMRTVHFVNMPDSEPDTYRIFADTYPLPDGDGALQEDYGKDTSLFGYDKNNVAIRKKIRYKFITQLKFFGFTKGGLLYNSSGVVESPRWIRLVRQDYVITNPDTFLAADLDCLEAVSTRLNIGLFNDGTKVCEGR